MTNLSYDAKMREAMQALTQWGAFLTTSADGAQNTMAIGWGSIGFAWGKPLFTVLVRNTRYTHELLEKATEFVVSIPLTDHMQKELEYCGTQSGRDIDKFRTSNLKTAPGQKVSVPIIAGCQLHYECRILTSLPISLDELHESCHQWYADDYHILYVGEILACYEIA